jgi:3-vinyl bacteriochlorophyllide hydratase
MSSCLWGSKCNGAIVSLQGLSGSQWNSPQAVFTCKDWTLVQGVLAPVQFLVFLISLGLVLRYLATGEGLAWAHASIVVKTLVLYTDHGDGLHLGEGGLRTATCFAPAFFWEDVVSMGWCWPAHRLSGGCWPPAGVGRGQMMLALAAYATYVVNAAQFLLKLRAARLRCRAGCQLARRRRRLRRDMSPRILIKPR